MKIRCAVSSFQSGIMKQKREGQLTLFPDGERVENNAASAAEAARRLRMIYRRTGRVPPPGSMCRSDSPPHASRRPSGDASSP